MTLTQAINYICSIPKTIYCNFRLLPFSQAIKMPLFISWDCKLQKMKKGIITFAEDVDLKPLLVAIGFNGTEIVPARKSLISLESGKLIFMGKANFAKGCVISVSGGTLTIGRNFMANKNFFVTCNKEITIGDDALMGWNVLFFDATGHSVYHNGIKKELYKSIIVGKHVWICAETHLLKGAHVPDGCVVAYRSLVTGTFDKRNSLIGGSPATHMQDNVT